MAMFPRKFGVFVCCHVFNNERPILLVVHEHDGDWGFYCGQIDHSTDDGGKDYSWVGVGHLIDRDETVNDTALLDRGSEMERSEIGGKWIKTSFIAQ